MMRTNEMPEKGWIILPEREKKGSAPLRLVILCVYLAFPLILLFALTMGISLLMNGRIVLDVNDTQGLGDVLLQFSLPMLLALAFIPVLVKKKLDGCALEDLGIGFGVPRRTIILSLGMLVPIGIACYGLFIKKSDIGYSPWAILFQFTAVGIAEEVYVRGVLLNELKKSLRLLWACIVSALLFAFVLHSDGDMLTNLLIRFPLGLGLVGIRVYSGSLVPAILAHIAYNLGVSLFPIMF